MRSIDKIYHNTLANKLIKKGVLITNPQSCRLSFDTEIEKLA